MKFAFIAIAVLLSFSPAVRGEEVENPFAKAKVGDWVEYKTSGAFSGSSKMVVTSKTDKELIYEVTSKAVIMGKDLDTPPQKITVDLTKKYDPLEASKLPKVEGTKVEKTEGKEKIKVGGKEYDCTWVNIKSTMKVNDMVIESEAKTWYSKEVPLGGAVKTEVKSQFGGMTMELTGHGSK